LRLSFISNRKLFSIVVTPFRILIFIHNRSYLKKVNNRIEQPWAQWDETAKEIRLFSLPIDIGAAFGLDLELSFQVDVQSLLEYSKTQGTFVPEKGMVKTAAYERDDQISSQIKGFSTVINQYVTVINAVLEKVLETIEKIKEAGKELIVETGDAIVAGGAKIKAGATAVVSGAKLKLTKLLGRDGRSFRIRADARIGESAASTVGDLFVVSLTDNAGNLMEPDAPLELTLGYTEADLNAAGFTLADAALLRVYRRNPDTGYYEALSSVVNTSAHSVTAMISELGQYVLAIDGAAPEIADFTFTAGTLTPELRFSLMDTLSGIDLSSVSITLDGTEVVSSSNISEYFNIHSGAFQWTVPENLSQGEHLLRVYAKDTAGNAADKTFAFTINNSPPVITHTPVTQTAGGSPLTITADVTDDQELQTVLLCYRAKTSELPYILTEMSGTAARTGQYSGTIPSAYLTSFGTRYFIRAVDLSGNVSETEPADITVADNAGPQMPGTPVAAPSAEGYRLIPILY
ncbi:MAG: Ig-like domain-containing protein, partial [Desulfococcaceae bacterium]